MVRSLARTFAIILHFIPRTAGIDVMSRTYVAQVEPLVKACAMSVATHPCYVVRRALAAEQNAICALVRSERLNPHHLHFENFAVAVRGDEVIGASQIRRHRDGSRELGSVVVARPWRGRGISAELIGSLLKVETQTLYVITRLKHAHHYASWGFVAIPPRAAPGAIRRQLPDRQPHRNADGAAAASPRQSHDHSETARPAGPSRSRASARELRSPSSPRRH